MDDRPRGDRRGGFGLGGLGLGRHAGVRVQRGCHAGARGIRPFWNPRNLSRRNSVHDAGNEMLVTGSGGPRRRAARTAASLDLGAIAKRAGAHRAARLTDPLMVGATRAGRGLLGVTGATVPDTFAEGHAGSSRSGGANVACARASAVPSS
jgi:hypothetical protein